MGQPHKLAIDLAAAADAESFGALAVGRPHPLRGAELVPSVAALRSLLAVLKKAGALTHSIKVGKSSLRLRVKELRHVNPRQIEVRFCPQHLGKSNLRRVPSANFHPAFAESVAG